MLSVVSILTAGLSPLITKGMVAVVTKISKIEKVANTLDKGYKILKSSKTLNIASNKLLALSKKIEQIVGSNPCISANVLKPSSFDLFFNPFINVAYASGPCKSDLTEIYEAAAKNIPLGKGSTGRMEPNNIGEQVAMLLTRADPDRGTKLNISLMDPRWHADQGWEKWEAVFRNENENIVIHYVRNITEGWIDDFKFKN